MPFKTNLKQATSPNALKQLAQGALAAVPYAFVPTLLKLDGWAGMAVGALSGWFLGVLLGWPGMQVGAASIAGMHLMYTQGNGMVKSISGSYIWRFDNTAAIPPTTATDFGGLRNNYAGLMGYPHSQLNGITMELPGGAKPNPDSGLSGYGPNVNFNTAATGVGTWGGPF